VIRAVLDVNVLVSSIPSPQGTPAAIVRSALLREFQAVVSELMLESLLDVWGRPYFRSRLSDEAISDALTNFRSKALVVVPVDDVHGVADDAEDDLVIATAIAGEATYLVTGDRGLLRQDGYRGLVFITPADFRLVLDAPAITVSP